MSKEKVRILNQVEEGKITVEQALTLLEKLDKSDREERWADGISEIRGAVSEVLHEVGDSLKDAGETVNDVMNEVGKEIRDNQDIRAAFSGLFSGLMGMGVGQLFEFEHSGVFEPGHVRVTLNGANGKLMVRRWSEPGFKLVSKVRVKNSSGDGARTRAAEAYDLVASGEELRLDIKSGVPKVSVSAELFLPEGNTYDMRLDTSNGSIKVDGVEGNEFIADTSNGSVVLEDCWFADAKVDTSNGAVSLSGTCGNASVRTSNGSIRVESGGADDSRLNLVTSNGSITLVINAEQDVGYSIDASTSNGRVSADVDGLNIKTSGKNQLEAKSLEFESKPRKLYIVARTSNGRVNITKR